MKKRNDDGTDMSPLRLVAVQLHEMFTELKGAGFSRREALHLIGMMITHGMVDGMEDK